MKYLKTNHNNDAIERRYHFRIDVTTLLQYRLLPQETETSIKLKPLKNITDEFTIGTRFANITHELRPVMASIESQSPNIATYLTAIDRKLSMLAELLMNTSSMEQKPQKVNLSAGGLSFDSTVPLPVDSILEVKLALLPSSTGIISYAKVIYCSQSLSGHGNTNSYNLAVEFIDMTETDRDLISRHVLNTEAESLRRKKASTLTTLS